MSEIFKSVIRFVAFDYPSPNDDRQTTFSASVSSPFAVDEIIFRFCTYLGTDGEDVHILSSDLVNWQPICAVSVDMTTPMEIRFQTFNQAVQGVYQFSLTPLAGIGGVYPAGAFGLTMEFIQYKKSVIKL
jgi:hypothetical protein